MNLSGKVTLCGVLICFVLLISLFYQYLVSLPFFV